MESVLSDLRLNSTMGAASLPPLPEYNLVPQPPLLSFIEDKYLALALPIIGYWVFSMVFHLIDEYDLFPQYRLHTPAEVLKRNRVSRYEVVRDVVIQQVVQTIMGAIVAYYEPSHFVGKDEFSTAVWAQRIRLAQRFVPTVLATVGLDSKALSSRVLDSSPSLSGFLAGGQYPSLSQKVNGATYSAFASWELQLASAIYWVVVPALQFSLAVVCMDTWQYFLHRAMHLNKWLYTTFHSRHHRLYVPYAYGALYNHPFEGFLLDTCGAILGYTLAGLSPRQSMWFFTCSTLKTVDDHCGYALPFDPLQHLTSNNAGYHDVHHQSWGIKTNFSQPFFTFWDRLLGTQWTGGDVSLRYERARNAAQKKVDDDKAKNLTNSDLSAKGQESMNPYPNELAKTQSLARVGDVNPQALSGKARSQAAASREQVIEDKSVAGGVSVLGAEAAEEEKEKKAMRARAPSSTQHPRRRTLTSESGGLRGITDRVSNLPGACFK